MAVYKSTKVETFLENKQKLVVNEILTNQNKPKTVKPFQMGKHANLEGSNLNNQQRGKVQDLFMRHRKIFSRNSSD